MKKSIKRENKPTLKDLMSVLFTGSLTFKDKRLREKCDKLIKAIQEEKKKWKTQ